MLRAGWKLVWRRQRLVWWVYILSLGLAWLAAQPLVSSIAPILNHSLAADRLYHSMDGGALAELLAHPDVSLGAVATGPMFGGVVFLVLMLFMTGGILKVYNEDRTFQTGEFFGASGQFFWRFLRLVVLLLIILTPIGLVASGFRAWSGRVADQLASPTPHVGIELAGSVLVLFLLLSVRVWFDMAEVHAVAEDEYAVRRSLVRAWKLLVANFRSLFWLYFRISLIGWLGTAAALWSWVHWVRPQSVSTSFLIMQFIVFLGIVTRLWQRASETLWYRENAPPVVLWSENATSMEPAEPEPPPAEVAI